MVRARRAVNAPAAEIFALVAAPAAQPRWDGNANLASARPGRRVRSIGIDFTMTLAGGSVRENHVVEFEEDRLIAWLPAEAGHVPAGHLWRWELQPLRTTSTSVQHTYDWTRLADEHRVERARSTTSEHLQRSLDRLAQLAERHRPGSA